MSKVVPSPVTKRRKLSLKAPIKLSDDASSTQKSEALSSSTWKEPAETENESRSGISHKEIHEEVDIQPSPDELGSGPGILGFQNLGNTCFLNSVLQILRYTPGFLDGLEVLNKDVTEVEKLKKEENEDLKKEQGDVCVKSEENLSGQVVKILHQLFTRMEDRENKLRKLGSSAIAALTVKPDRLLEILRRINPMFEGYLQHDAQELLRCLLCYLQDAWKEIGKVRSQHRELQIKKAKENGIMKYFGEKCANQEKVTAKMKKNKGDVKMALFAEKTKQNGTNEPGNKLLAHGWVEGNETEITMNNSNEEKTEKPVIPHTNRHVASDQKQMVKSYDETDSMLCPSISVTSPSCNDRRSTNSSPVKRSPVTPVTKSICIDDANVSGGRRRTRRSNGTPSPVCSNGTSTSKSKRGSKRKKSFSSVDQERPVGVRNDGDKKDSPEGASVVNELVGGHKTQPTVLSMFGKQEVGCKRLGMRGAVLAKVQNGIEAPEDLDDKSALETATRAETCLPDHTGDGPSVIPHPAIAIQDTGLSSPCALRHNKDVTNTVGRSPGKRCPGVLEHVSETNLKSAALQDIKQAKVKLEKCDTVCDSPLKSVSANEAIRKLGVPSDKERDFVEHLFQGMMMLRTRCTECECARERQEVFQDVSVPLKTALTSEEEAQNESDEEPEESSLSCLMSAFTDVERLCGVNKYFCENCVRYVEAERSLHYESLPEILTLHLKRFAATSGYFGNLTKINDHVATPEYLPCLRYKCPRPCYRQDHQYKLFGVIAHSGMSITSGHYISYVKLLPESTPVQKLTMKVKKKSAAAALPRSPKWVGKSSRKVKQEMVDKDGKTSANQCATGCARGAAALPEESRRTIEDSMMTGEDSARTVEDSVQPIKTEEDKLDDSVTSDPGCSYGPEDFVDKWLECDDDFIQVLHDDDFDRRLAPNSGYNATPYVLFYIKDKDAF